MKYHTDSFFTIGDTHEICQDYALAGTTKNGIPYAIVCDGCSGATGQVDFGARIVAHGLVQCIEEVGYNTYLIDDVNKMVMHDLRTFILDEMHSFNLTVDDFFVTIEAVFIWKDIAFRLRYGDGVHIRNNDFFNYEFTSGAPFYLAYNMNATKEMYLDQFGKFPIRLHASFKDTFESTSVESWIGCRMWSSYEPLSNPKAGYNILAVASDGLLSFSLAEQPCDLMWVVDEIVSVKNFNYGFLNRRMKKFLKKETLSHYDDVSVAMIIVERDGHAEN